MNAPNQWGKPQFDRLEKRRNAEFNHTGDDDFGHLCLRLRRGVSWLGRAERELRQPAQPDADIDAAFVFYWIAFNAAYGDDSELAMDLPERSRFAAFFSDMARLDGNALIYDALWNRFSNEVRSFIGNRFVYDPFWKHYNGVDGFADWRERFDRDSRIARNALARMDTARVLEIVFARMYVLRNQIIHGGATWNSSRNRPQVTDGVRIMARLAPLFIDLMMDNPNVHWGKPYYTVVPENYP